MSHYFINDPNLKNIPKTIYFELGELMLQLNSNEGLFSKQKIDFGTKLLLENILIKDDQNTIVDIGCGYGIIGLYIAKKWPNKSVIMVDVNENAINMSKENAKINNISNVEIKNSFLLDKINQQVDLCISNPPIRAGKEVVFKLYEEAYNKLTPNGALFIVIQKKQGAPSTIKKLKELFNEVNTLKKEKGYFIIQAIK